MTVKLHVGYFGKTREGKRVEITRDDGPGDIFGRFHCSDDVYRHLDGSTNIDESRLDIVGPWVEPDTQEPGEWIGWNGGECPVHPDAVVEVTDGEKKRTHKAGIVAWCMIIAYRVIKEHKEPREFWIYPDTGIIKITKPACPHAIHVREVTE